ncbi:MAG: hypothetical protein ABJE66_12150 [Deltaproteobacteria bacterium]
MALLLVCAASAVAAAKPTVAILGLEVIDKTGVPSNDDVTFAKTLTEDLRGRAKLGGPYTLANGADKELIDLKLLKGCDDDKDLKCMSGIGGDLGVDFLMYGSVTKKGSNYEITISLLDVKQRHREKTAPTTVPTSTNAGTLLKKSQSIYNGLTGQTDSCTITVKTPGVDRATILLGTKEAGNITNGVGQVNGLSDGKYTIAVEAKDYHRWTKSDIQCTGGETTNITADLSKLDAKIIPPPDKVNPPGGDGSENHEITGSISHHGSTNSWKYVAIGGGILTAAAAITFGVKWSGLAKTGASSGTFQYGAKCVNDDAHTKAMFPNGFNADADTQSACNDAPSNRTWSYVTGVGTVALLGVTVFSVVKAVSNNDSMSDEHASLGHRRHHEPFAITPVVSPTGAGATFRMEW